MAAKLLPSSPASGGVLTNRSPRQQPRQEQQQQHQEEQQQDKKTNFGLNKMMTGYYSSWKSQVPNSWTAHYRKYSPKVNQYLTSFSSSFNTPSSSSNFPSLQRRYLFACTFFFMWCVSLVNRGLTNTTSPISPITPAAGAEGELLAMIPPQAQDPQQSQQSQSQQMRQLRSVSPTRSVSGSTIISRTTTTSSSCTEFRDFPKPAHHTGLPYLGDVFATRDKQYITFIGMNRGMCFKDFAKTNGDAYMDAPHRFLCMFPDNTAVISEFVAPTGDVYHNNYLFRCKIPTRFQHLLENDQATTTELHIDLHALHDPERPPKGMHKWIDFPSMEISETPKLSRIPICPAGKWPHYNLVAYTRVQSTYLTQPDKEGKRETRTTTHRIVEWMEYHMAEGFDHFFVYDNDPTPHGPMEQLMQPYVDAGWVTYRWFPLEDCTIESGGKQGKIKRYGQAAGGLSAMHRLGKTGATYMAHMDIDEFFVVFDPHTSVYNLTQRILNSNTGSPVVYDAMEWHPQVMEYCPNTVVSDADVRNGVVDKKRCLTKFRYAKQKLIMRMDKMMHFQVHYPLATWTWHKPKTFVANDVLHPQNGVGFLAHYRGEITPGLHESAWPQQLHFFDAFLEARKNKNGQQLGVYVDAYQQFNDSTPLLVTGKTSTSKKDQKKKKKAKKKAKATATKK